MIVIAHRGASATFPENTIEAFRGAAEQGADWVELDARRTADHSLVVHHDALLADGRAIVASDTEVDGLRPALTPESEVHRLWGADAAPQFPDDGALPEPPPGARRPKPKLSLRVTG